MRGLHLGIGLLITCYGSVAAGFELSKVERKLNRPPSTESKAKYCLLVFGTSGKTQRWLALDDTVIYVDRNGNRDLTDDGEPVKRESGWTQLGNIDVSTGTFTNLRIQLGTDSSFRLRVNTPRSGGQYVGFAIAIRPTFADAPEVAPIIHFGGAMTLGQYGPRQTIPRNTEGISYRVTSLKLMLGTPGIGDGTFAAYHCNCRRKNGVDSTLVGKFVYQNSNAGDPIRREATYAQRG